MTTSYNYQPPESSNSNKNHKRRLVLIGLVVLVIGLPLLTFEDARILSYLTFVVATIIGLIQLIPSNVIITFPNEKVESIAHKRAKMLDSVYLSWILGALHKNLPVGNSNIQLSLQPHAVLRRENYDDYELPSSSRNIETIFQDMGRQLLILGEPGSGKTILLLQLTEKLLVRAQQDNKQPIPVVFNLSSWGKDRLPLKDWLIEQFNLGYGLNKKTALKWIDNGDLILLLDGLDEISPSPDFMVGIDKSEATLEEKVIELRSACINAINIYQAEHPNVSMVVCSRNQDYEMLNMKLNLNSAILLHALTDAQVNKYLQDNDLQGLRNLLKYDNIAREISKSPFLLTLMKETYVAIPYKGSPYNQLKLEGESKETRRDHLLEKYIALCIQPDPKRKYTKIKIQHLLRWLAWQMAKHKTSIFYIEDLQPDWMNQTSEKSLLGFILRILGKRIKFSEDIYWRFSSIELLLGISGGMIAGFLYSLFLNLPLFMAAYFATVGLTIGIILGLFGRFIIKIIISAFKSTKPIDRSLRIFPNAGLRRSLYNSILIMFFTGLLSVSLILIPMFVLVYLSGSLISIISMLFVAIIVFGLAMLLGLSLAVSYGDGVEVIKHILLRLVLANENVIPRWRYDEFLDYCADLGLLRKVGGGYIFRHRLLLEHFAEYYERQQPTTTNESPPS